jgi:diacylglycerol O-acyltransferase / trehalose O-mycolyltransferase / mycolyltransferase Ag85
VTRRACPADRRLLAGLTVVALTAGCTGTASPTATPTSTPGPPTTATATATAAPAPTPTTVPTIGLPADDGARIIAVESPTTLQHAVAAAPGTPGCPADSNPGCWVPVGSPIPTTRIRDLTIDSPVEGITKVRLFLPNHFDVQPSTRWPVLYLYRGSGGDYRRWSEAQDAMTLTAPTDLLVVMPEGDNDRLLTWATYHLIELRQLLERNWQAGDRRAVAGISAGGGEAMHEAASSPGMFRFAGSYSGNLDTRITGYVISDEAALKGTALYVAYGNGEVGPLDHGQAPFYDPGGDGEKRAAAVGAAFVKRLGALKIPVTVYAYGNGTHSAPYWQRDFERSFPLILKALGL